MLNIAIINGVTVNIVMKWNGGKKLKKYAADCVLRAEKVTNDKAILVVKFAQMKLKTEDRNRIIESKCPRCCKTEFAILCK